MLLHLIVGKTNLKVHIESNGWAALVSAGKLFIWKYKNRPIGKVFFVLFSWNLHIHAKNAKKNVAGVQILQLH